MKIYKHVLSDKLELQKIICDSCKGEFTDEFEIQEFLSIEKENGFASIFGDGTISSLDLCQYCVKKILGQYLTIFNKDDIA
jgi:antitoxin CcdA